MLQRQNQLLLYLLSLVIRHIYFQSTVQALAFNHEGWRIAMSIGREPGTGMPNDWASSGCRLPVVVQCDFQQQESDSGGRKNVVVPLTGEVRFTGPDGEVVRPVEKGEWSLDGGRELSFTLGFPEQLVRRDVTLDGVVKLEGLIYSVDDLKRMDEKFYEARNERWDAGEALNDVDRRKNAPKKWNPDTNQWEQRFEDEGLFSQLGKQVNLLFAEQSERQINRDRPMLKDLSLDCGPFPGVEGDVYFRKKGKVLLKRGFMRESIIGTWFAEPINDKPLSYY